MIRLPDSVTITDPDSDIGDLAARFRPFEALHHGLDICVPMSEGELDAVVDALAPGASDAVLDIACGHGAMLVRLSAHTPHATGIDSSPWAVRRCHALLSRAGRHARLLLGDAARLAPDRVWDRLVCIGAAWIFHGFAGTIQALARRARPAGRLAIGDLRLREGAGELAGRAPTRSDQLAAVDVVGGTVVGEVVAHPDSWRAYGAAVTHAAATYAADHPSDPAADQRALAARWTAEAEHDRGSLDFSVLVVQLP